MTLAEKFAFEFDKRIQFKGQGIARSGVMRVRKSGPDFFHSFVAGRDYRVNLDLDGDILEVSCECPYFDEWGPCKHLWAAMLEADRHKALQNALERKSVELVPVTPEEDDVLFEHE